MITSHVGVRVTSLPSYLTGFAARLDQMKEYRVLQDVAGHLVDASKGVIVCACGDCDQERSYTGYLANALNPRMHRIQVNGGPLAVPVESRLHYDTADDGTHVPVGQTVLLQLRNSVELKNIKAVVMVAHVPCGAALSVRMSIDDLVYCLIAAKRRFADTYRESLQVRVACFLHIDWEQIAPEAGKRPRTYFVSREYAERWFAAAPPPRLPSSRVELTPTYAG